MEPRARLMKTLKHLLREECSAMWAYRAALARLRGGRGASFLTTILDDHRERCERLRAHLVAHGDDAELTMALSETWCRASGDGRVLLEGLRDGEQECARAYQRALDEQLLPDACRVEVERDILRRQVGHVGTLNRLINLFGLGELALVPDARVA